jgi:BirA family transcriptional regulator, biotin operon repressor / biotin---[acetyl-CoA-carboxylase] ligase
VTASEQSSGRGRQGRTWSAPAGHALLMSLVLRGDHDLLPLAAAVAVARTCGEAAAIKWPNDVLIDGRKVAGILVEGRPQEGWAVVGIGLNVAIRVEDLPPELHATAGTLGRAPADVEPVLAALLGQLGAVLALDRPALLGAYRERDALAGRRVSWAAGAGTAAGVDDDGRLLVDADDGARVALDAGEVHLSR